MSEVTSVNAEPRHVIALRGVEMTGALSVFVHIMFLVQASLRVSVFVLWTAGANGGKLP